MKPTSLILKLAPALFMLGAIAQQSSAQYSLNVVGYVNAPMQPGWSLLANPLRYTNDNANFTFVSGPPPDGAMLYRFDPFTQAYREAGNYLAGVGWYPVSGNTNDSVLNLAVGEGFFVWSPRSWTNTFVGEVLQGNLTNPIPANYSLKGSLVPQAGLLRAALAFPDVPNDIIRRLTATVWTGPPFDESINHGGGNWDPTEPFINVAQGFFVHRDVGQASVANWWVRNFIVQAAPGPDSLVPSANPPPQINGFTVRDGVVTLKVNYSANGYNVQFSTDRAEWVTIATHQTAATWKGQLPSGPRGFFQVTLP